MVNSINLSTDRRRRTNRFDGGVQRRRNVEGDRPRGGVVNVAFVAFDGMTALDFVGVYDPVTRIETMGFASVEWDICARTESVSTSGLTLDVDRIEPDLGTYDLVVVPGGTATRTLREEDAFVDWLRSAGGADLVASVCTGALLLGAAGLLHGRDATTHPNATSLLKAYATVRDDRIVHDGPIVTAGGVAAALDLGLYLVEVLEDERTRTAIAEQMDYPYGMGTEEGL